MNATIAQIALAAAMNAVIGGDVGIETNISNGTVVYVPGKFMRFNREDGTTARAHKLATGAWDICNTAHGWSQAGDEAAALDLFCAIVATA
jgi:hypothetical protein